MARPVSHPFYLVAKIPKGFDIMATAAQLRARAAFTKIMKSGGFPASKKRKTSSAKESRKKNPVARSGGSGRQGVDADFNRQQRGLARGGKNSRGNPIFEISSSDATYQREKNPAKRRVVKTRPKAKLSNSAKLSRGISRSRSGPYASSQATYRGTGREMNPIRPVMSYVVYEARHGVAGKAIGAFPSKPAAVQFGRAWSDMKRCPVLIHGKGAR